MTVSIPGTFRPRAEGMHLTYRETKQAVRALRDLGNLMVNQNGIVMPMRNTGGFRTLIGIFAESS